MQIMQIKVSADKIMKYTLTKYWIRAHESYVIIIHLCTSSVLHNTQVEVFFEKGKHDYFQNVQSGTSSCFEDLWIFEVIWDMC